ncbi:hypothetical protein EYD10_08628 [Varanus komodoensis]|nr:hypothetical protein EYD10_08628 [Varanus komodoensis]
MASGPLSSWQIDGEEMEVVTDFIFLGSKITADRDCSQEIKRRLLLGRKAMANLDSILKSRDITLPTKVRIVKAMVFRVAMYGCESWTIRKAEGKRIEPLNCGGGGDSCESLGPQGNPTGFPESIVNILKQSQSGNALTAYAMYKKPYLHSPVIAGLQTDNLFIVSDEENQLETTRPLFHIVFAVLSHFPSPYQKDESLPKQNSFYSMWDVIATPARYMVTLGGTSITVNYLRKRGYMSTPPPVKEYIQDRMEETKERLSGKMEETRDMISGKMEETKERLTGKMEETKERITEKIQETKEKVSFIKKKE